MYDDYGNLRYFPNLWDVDKNEMRLMVDGKQFLVSADKSDKAAMLMMETLKGEEQTGGTLVNALSKVNRYLAAINTSWSHITAIQTPSWRYPSKPGLIGIACPLTTVSCSDFETAT